jgi:signal transduction histidine kinase
MELQVSVFENFAELAQAMRDGTVDSASYLPMWPEARVQFGWSEPIISMPIAVFGRPDSALLLDISALDHWQVAIERPSRAQEIFEREWPQIEFIDVASTRDGLFAVRDGRANYFVHNVFSVEYERRQRGIDVVRIALQTPYSFDVRISTSLAFAPLVPMVNKVIASLSDHERSLIFDKWVNSSSPGSEAWRQALLTGSAIFGGILLVLGGTILWNRRLTREVEARTRDLAESREVMRALAQHLDRVREEEKSRIALEMHDDLGHSLTAMTMSLRRLGRLLQKEPTNTDTTEAQVEELLQMVKQASATSRRIMSDLRPSVLNDLGLVAAIEWLAHDFEEHAGIHCVVDAEVGEPEVPDEAAIALFRIAQEALTNVAKHAQAATATISLRLEANRLVLEIADDGIGIAPDWSSKKGSFGLIGMRERAIAIGGELHVLSGLKSGGRVRVEVPLASHTAEPAAA